MKPQRHERSCPPQRWHDPENNAPSATELRQAAAGHEIDQETEQLNGEILNALAPLTLNADISARHLELEDALANLRQLIRDARLIGYEDGQRPACNLVGRLAFIRDEINDIIRLTA